MNFQFVRRVIEGSINVTAIQFRILIMLSCKLIDERNYIYRSYSDIAKDCYISRSTCIRAMKGLVDDGVISIERQYIENKGFCINKVTVNIFSNDCLIYDGR